MEGTVSQNTFHLGPIFLFYDMKKIMLTKIPKSYPFYFSIKPKLGYK